MSLPLELAPTDASPTEDGQECRELILGVDIGKSSAFAAISWFVPPESLGPSGDSGSKVDVIALEEETAATNSALYVDEQGYLLTGELAQDGALAAPERMITGFHHRIGDEIPLVVDSGRFSPESLSAVLLEWIIELASQRYVAELAEPSNVEISQLVVTHPGEWGGYRKELLWNALQNTLSNPAAAADTPEESVAIAAENSRTVALVAQPIAAARGYFIDPVAVGVTIGVWEPDPTGSAVFFLRMNDRGDWEILSHQEIPPADSVEELIHQGMNGLLKLARRSEVHLGSLFGTILYGSWSVIPSLSEIAQAKFPCQILSHSESEALAAKGAAMGGRSHRAKAFLSEKPLAEQTIVLPRLSLARNKPREEQPKRPPVSVAPFSPSNSKRLKGVGKKWLGRKGSAS